MRKHVLGLFFILLFISSCRTIRQQVPKISVSELPIECSSLLDFISKNWYKHKHKKCHKETFNIFEFCNENRVCLESLTKEQVIMLLGSPDITRFDDIFGYVINKDCKDKSLLGYYFLEFHFIPDHKNRVEVIVVSGTS